MRQQFTILHLIAAVLAGVALAAITFWEGSRIGVQQFEFADAKYKASILAFQLQALKRQNMSTLETGMQIELNTRLAQHGEYLESNWKWLWPELHSETDREIKGAVKFRLENPYSEPDMSSPSNWNSGMDMSDPFVIGVIAGQRRNKELVAKILAKYGQ
jgi:hypothetical protein